MASFDLGPTAMGARIMMMLDRRRVALFTGEGACTATAGESRSDRSLCTPRAAKSH